MLDLLITYRYLIWLTGGTFAFWLLANIPAWQRVARNGTWNAERDHAAWRVRYAFLGLCLLVSVLTLTTLATFRS